MHRILLALLAVCLVSACSNIPTLESDPETETIRTQYLSENPNGSFNANIKRGEVVKGMNFVEVLASWGVPTRRESSRSGLAQAWVYKVRDEGTSNYIVYELKFDDRVLTDWSFGRHSGGVGVVATHNHAGTSLPTPAGMPFAGGAKRINLE